MLSIGLNKERFKISLKLYSTKVDYDKAIGGRSLSIHQERTIRIGWKNEKEENQYWCFINLSFSSLKGMKPYVQLHPPIFSHLS